MNSTKFSATARRFLMREVKAHARELAFYVPLSVLGIGLELTGVMLVYPFMLVLLDPEMIRHFGWLNWLTRTLGIAEPMWLHVFLILGIAFLLIGKNAFMVFFHYFQQKKMVDWKADLSGRLMFAYMASDFQLFLEKTTPEIIRNLALTGVVYDQFFRSLINIVLHVVLLAALCITLLFFIPLQILFALAVMVGTVMALHFLRKSALIKVGKTQAEVHKDRQQIWQQSIGSIKDTKMLGRESYFIDLYATVERSFLDNQRQYNFLSVLPPLFMETALMLSILGVIGMVIMTESSRSEALAILGVLIFVMFRMLPPFNRILVSVQLIHLSRESVEILAKEVEELSANDKQLPLTTKRLPFRDKIVFDNVSFRYPHTDEYALRNISFEMPARQFIGITGPSGCGKSTLMGLLLGLLKPTEGKILIDGKPLHSRTMIREWQNAIGFVPQGIFLINDTIRRNVAFAMAEREIDPDHLAWAVEKSRLDEYVDSLPDGVDTPVHENGRNLSGGQRQRIGIARALYRKPSLLAFDEATSALDVVAERSITESVQALHGEVTVIAIAHRLNTLQNCNQILMMGKGHLIDIGTFEELAVRCPEFRQLVKLSALPGQAAAREDDRGAQAGNQEQVVQ